jgi:hypothetical protein
VDLGAHGGMPRAGNYQTEEKSSASNRLRMCATTAPHRTMHYCPSLQVIA